MTVPRELGIFSSIPLIQLDFGTFAKALKLSFAEDVADTALIELIYSCVLDPKKNKISVRKDTASYIMNHQKGGNPRQDVTKSGGKMSVKTLVSNFQARIIPNINDINIIGLINFFSALIKNDNKLEPHREKLLGLASEEKLPEFLAMVFKHSLNVQNIYENQTASKFKSKKIINQGSLLELAKTRLPDPDVPEEPTEIEQAYVSALMAVWAQKHGRNYFNKNMLKDYPQDDEFHEEQRRYFYAAEEVRHAVREIDDGTDFQELKDEIYEGIKENWQDAYPSGEKRLREVLKEVTKVILHGCRLERETELVKNPVRKGVCHFLVNDGKISGWVRKDDGQSV